jgi:WD repeat-containing protein 70
MDNTEMMAAMGIAGFGKQVKKRELDPARFDKNKREQVSNAWRIIARSS